MPLEAAVILLALLGYGLACLLFLFVFAATGLVDKNKPDTTCLAAVWPLVLLLALVFGIIEGGDWCGNKVRAWYTARCHK